MSALSGSGTAEDERTIARVLKRYCQLLDEGQVAQVADQIFTEDAIADYNFDILNGRREIHEYLVFHMGRYKATAHPLSNISLNGFDGKSAEITAMIIALHWMGDSGAAEPNTSADFGQVVLTDDRLVRTADGWRIAHHCARAMGPSFVLTEGSLVLRRGN